MSETPDKKNDFTFINFHYNKTILQSSLKKIEVFFKINVAMSLDLMLHINSWYLSCGENFER